MAEYDFADMYEKLLHYYRIRTSPVAIKFFADVEEMRAIPEIEIGARHMSPCMLVGAAARQNRTIGITTENFQVDYCRTIHGFMEKNERFMSAQPFLNRWNNNIEAARGHHAALNCVSPAVTKGFAVAPLQSGNIQDPDVCALYTTPGQMFHILAAYQNIEYKKLDLSFVGESTCSDSWIRTKIDGKPGIGMGSFGERSYGNHPEDELLLSMTPTDLDLTLAGAVNLRAGGMMYPVPNLGLYCGDLLEVKIAAFEGY